MADAKTCVACGLSKPLAEFAKDRSRPDGLTYLCKPCRNAASRRTYVSKGRPAHSGPQPAAARDGDKRQARRRVNVLVQTGRLPHPNSLPCADCGHLGQDRRHEYDHHQGYAAEHHLDVEAVCATCHHNRSVGRGEWVRERR